MGDACRFQVSVPKFSRGRILKSQALEELRDFPRSLASLGLRDYTDGVIWGFEVSGASAGKIMVSEGVLKHKGELIAIHEPHRLEVLSYRTLQVVTLTVCETNDSEDYKTFGLYLALKTKHEPRSDTYELARFRLEEGTVLRGVPDYLEFSDFATEYNTVNYLHTSFSGARLPGVPQALLRCFALTLLKQDVLEEIDRFFCLQVLGSSVDREAVLCYLSIKTGTSYKNYTNEEIYHKLHTICFHAQKEHTLVKASVPGRRASIF